MLRAVAGGVFMKPRLAADELIRFAAQVVILLVAQNIHISAINL